MRSSAKRSKPRPTDSEVGLRFFEALGYTPKTPAEKANLLRRGSTFAKLAHYFMAEMGDARAKARVKRLAREWAAA